MFIVSAHANIATQEFDAVDEEQENIEVLCSKMCRLKILQP